MSKGSQTHHATAGRGETVASFVFEIWIWAPRARFESILVESIESGRACLIYHGLRVTGFNSRFQKNRLTMERRTDDAVSVLYSTGINRQKDREPLRRKIRVAGKVVNREASSRTKHTTARAAARALFSAPTLYPLAVFACNRRRVNVLVCA